MNITDEMLYAAAPEAAERWLDTLPGREDCGHNFSLTFEASMWAAHGPSMLAWKAERGIPQGTGLKLQVSPTAAPRACLSR